MIKLSNTLISIVSSLASFFWIALLPAFAEDAAHVRLSEIIALNSLTGPDKTPFHLKMSFQYYDLAGKPGDVGVLEEWWAAPGSFLITVALPSVNQGQPFSLDSASRLDPREEYTFYKLLEAEIDPMSGHNPNAEKLNTEFRKRVGKNDLRCFGPAEGQIDLCTDPQDSGIRLRTMGKTVVVMRNTLGIFEKTHIASEIAVAYGGTTAIIGRLQKIEAFDPAQSTVVISQHPPNAMGPSAGAGIVPGKLLKRVDPEIPLYMPDSRGSVTPPLGSWNVLVSCRIMKDGTTSRVFAVNSPGAAFTQSAIEAVKKFRFEPSLYKDKPVELPIDVEVNFERYNHN